MQRSISEANMATRFPTILKKSLTLFAAAAAALGGGALLAAPAKTNWLQTFSLTPKGSHIIGNPAAATTTCVGRCRAREPGVASAARCCRPKT